MFEFDERKQSALFFALCPLSLALMGLGVKMSHQLPVAIVLLSRFGISAGIYSVWLWGSGFNFRQIRPFRHILRTLLGFTSVACLFGAISRIPLSAALCLSYTVPIFSYVISICSRQLGPDHRVLYVLGSVCAITMIVQPSADVNLLGVILALASAFFGALALFEIKRITKTEGPKAILFMYFLFSTTALSIYVAATSDHSELLPNTSSLLPALIAVGIFGLLYQLSLVGALKVASVGAVSLALLVAVALGYIIDIFVFDIEVTSWAILGTVLLAVCIGLYSRTGNASSE